jgi:5'-nucleotidase
MKILIFDKNNFEKTKNEIKKDGLSNLHILADFDRTLTYGTIDGKKTPSIISLLRDGKHLTDDYNKKAHELFDKYHKIEIDPSVSIKIKKNAMEKWWKEHHELLIDSKLNKKDLEDIVKNGHIKFREGVEDFLDFLYENNIPLIIFSASGCGDAIPLFFQKYQKDYSNIFYIINKFDWDKDGKAISSNYPIVHSFNKDETLIKNIPEVFGKIENRKNVILLGDSLGDLGMVEGFEYKNLISVGFLNFDFDNLREVYIKNFDVVLEGDGYFDFVNKIMRYLI